ncbi:MAG: DUF1501 domain-containing protein [Planctomycetes bacterium]|nr:DUF1501 domain-containing protein [Planctomycetota bacterium]
MNESNAAPLSRRKLLSAAVPGLGSGLPRLYLRGASKQDASAEPRDVLVHVLLRGGMDGLTTCVPHGDPHLYTARPTLAIAPPGSSGGALDLDGFFGLAPAAAPLLTPWGNGHLAIVHAAGSPDPTRSHFEAFARMELGIPLQPLGSVSSGWLARHLQVTPALGAGPLRAAALVDVMPMTLAQAPQTLPIPDLSNYAFPGAPVTAALRESLIAGMYAGAAAPLSAIALDTIGTIHLLDLIDFANYAPAPGANYPAGSELAAGLRQSAALIKADVGLECVMLELGGWDLHSQLGPLNGVMALLLDELCRSLEAFYLDMLSDIDRVVVVVMSEFGRRVAENGSAGLDHGHGNAMLLLGGHIAGGQVHGTWPGLAPAALDHGDVAITTDYRDVVGEVLAKRLGNTALAQVFPNHTVVFPGVVV